MPKLARSSSSSSDSSTGTSSSSSDSTSSGTSSSGSSSSSSSSSDSRSSSSSSSTSSSDNESSSSSTSSNNENNKRRSSSKQKRRSKIRDENTAPSQTVAPVRTTKRVSRSPQNRAKSPLKSTKIHVGNLTRNVTKEHVYEIFSTYGPIKTIDMPSDRIHTNIHRSFAYIDYEKSDDAERACKYMNEGQIDGQEIRANLVLLPQRPRNVPSKPSPPRRSQREMRTSGGGGGSRRSPNDRNYRRSSPSRRRSHERKQSPKRSRSPKQASTRRRHRSVSSSSSD